MELKKINNFIENSLENATFMIPPSKLFGILEFFMRLFLSLRKLSEMQQKSLKVE